MGFWGWAFEALVAMKLGLILGAVGECVTSLGLEGSVGQLGAQHSSGDRWEVSKKRIYPHA